MERPPSGESSLENRELSFAEQLDLATVLLQAVELKRGSTLETIEQFMMRWK